MEHQLGLKPVGKARPLPILRLRHHLGTQGVAFDIALHGDQAIVLLNGEGPEPALPEGFFHARISLTTRPCTSVRRKSRPWNR